MVAAVGCARPVPPPPPKKPLDVSVIEPIVHGMTKYEDFTGRTESFKYVEIRPQVTGELKKLHFKDGDTVREGTLLFVIDDRLYEAQRLNAVASLAKAKAVLEQTKADLFRADDARKRGVGSQADLDAAVANKDAALASIQAAEAAQKTANLNVEWCQIRAPFTGRMSRRLVDPGNIVTANTTPLTTIIDLSKIYIGFDIDEQTVERRREAIKAGEIPSAKDAKLEVQVGFGHQEGYPYKAVVTFADNQVDAGTGTLHIRAEMDNPLVRQGLSALIGNAAAEEAELKELRLLSPNMFTRVRLPLGKSYRALLIREEAIGSDQGHKYVFVVTEKNVVEYRKIQPGPIYRPDDPRDARTFRAVEERKSGDPPGEGVSRGERIVFGGQQRIKEGDTVNPKLLKQEPLAK